MGWHRRSSAAAAQTAVLLVPPPSSGAPAIDRSSWLYNGPTSSDRRQTTPSRSPLRILTAAGMRITRDTAMPKIDRGWQSDVWAMYDQVGELRYVSNALAGRGAQAILYVEKDGVRTIEQEDDPLLSKVTSQDIERMFLNIFLVGEVWWCGVPLGSNNEVKWFTASSREVVFDKRKVVIRGNDYADETVYTERIWDAHPATFEEPDSPVRSSLPVLRELVGMTQHVSASIDSRLAGAGLYWLPDEILQNPTVPNASEDPQFNSNPVLNAIMESMLIPMQDRDNASSVVPLLLGAPGDAISKIRYDTFGTPFDANAKDLRDEALRRLALSLDAPAELLLGMGDSNHWSAWLVRDEVVQTHIEPRLELICDALTKGYYRPILAQQGVEDPEAYCIKADVSQLILRPNRLQDASTLHAAGVISDEAFREAGGFSDEDAPPDLNRSVEIAVEIARNNPQLIDNLPEIIKYLDAAFDYAEGRRSAQSLPTEAEADQAIEEEVATVDNAPADGVSAA